MSEDQEVSLRLVGLSAGRTSSDLRVLNVCIFLPCASLLKESPTQIVLFSATFPDRVRNFASKFAPNANKIELKKEELSVEGIKQFYMDCSNEEAKYEILVQIYNLLTVGQSIIFTKVSSLHSTRF